MEVLKSNKRPPIVEARATIGNLPSFSARPIAMLATGPWAAGKSNTTEVQGQEVRKLWISVPLVHDGQRVQETDRDGNTEAKAGHSEAPYRMYANEAMLSEAYEEVDGVYVFDPEKWWLRCDKGVLTAVPAPVPA